MNQLEEYSYPTSFEEALSLLAKEGSEIIAGGTHLTTAKSQSITQLVDITRLPLNFIKKEGNQVRIGSTTTITEMVESPLVKEIGNGVVTKACQLIGDTPLRNRITLGGNIARLYPWVGLPVVLLVLDAVIVIKSQTETKKIPARDYFETKKLGRAEIITEVLFPVKNDWFCRYKKFALTTVDYTWLTMAFAAKNDGGVISDPHVAVSRITKPKRVVEVEKYLDGTVLANLDRDEALSTLKEAVNVVSDYRSSKEYRKHLLGIFFKRILSEIVQEVTG
ncbi:MAG: FAD binding domain-containing protein [Candidatus Heimdallarchaeota archaeon]|nr:MAG: FAD binding domain-containing protein [Candidatus Heimdallarchaeota archaeon]